MEKGQENDTKILEERVGYSMDKDKLKVVIKDITYSFGMVFAVYLLCTKNLAGEVASQHLMQQDTISALFFFHVGAAEIWMLIFFVKKLSFLGFALEVVVVDRLAEFFPKVAENGLVQMVPMDKLMMVGIAIVKTTLCTGASVRNV